MTSSGKDALWSLLFASDEYKLANLKLMCGDSRDVSLQDLRNEVHSAILQAKTSSSGQSDFNEAADMLNVDVRNLADAL